MTDDLPPMLSLIQTLCRLHLQHQWELYQELRGKAQGGAIRTQFTKLNDKPQLYLQPHDKAACYRYCPLFYTPQIPHSVQTHFREWWITDIAQMSPCINAKPRSVVFCKWHSTQPTPFLFPLSCLCTQCDGKADSVGGGALVHILIVSFSHF